MCKERHFIGRASTFKTMAIKSIVILVEMDNGSVHQVLTTRHQKEAALKICENDNSRLQLSEEIMPIEFEPKPQN